MKVGIIIPSYKNPEQLQRCEEHLKNSLYSDTIIRIEDNNEINRGFTRACNDGIKALWNDIDDYFILLNQDCYLAPEAITNMVDFMDANPKCAIGGIKQLSYDNRDLIVHAGCTEAFPIGKHISGSVKAGDHSENKRVPWVNGACMIVRKSAIIEIGLMDENFFLIGSDSDWCYTARDKGWEVWYIANAKCLHEGGASSKPPDEKTENIMKLDIVRWRDKWITDGVYRELSMEIFS